MQPSESAFDRRTLRDERGFTLLDLLATIAIVGVIVAIALPSTTQAVSNYRLESDARRIAGAVSLAKMRAAARFTRTRIFADLPANSFVLQIFDKTDATWITEGAATRTSIGVAFGLEALDEPPPNTQNMIGQSRPCRDDAGDQIENTACIVFNSRGIPIDDVGDPTGGNALYLTNGTTVYATTLTATPLVRLWRSPAAAASWTQE